MLIGALVIVGIILILAAVFSISDNLMQIEAQKTGIDTVKNNLGLVPSIPELFGKKAPAYADTSKYHALKKGHDIKISGSASGNVTQANVTRYAVKPGDFRGNAPIPKMVVTEGDNVKAGDELFFDKANPQIKYVAPVSGEIIEIRRGAKRSISHVVILADKDQSYKSFSVPSLEAKREDLVSFLQESGAWAHIIQRPYDIVADTEVIPQNIFISTFDTAPLATDLNLIAQGNEAHFQKGLDVLNKLTSGKIYLGLDGRGYSKPHNAYMNAANVEKHWFNGKHPAGNVGVQIHHIAPIRGLNSVWTLTPESVITIGKLFNEGIYSSERVVSVVGGQVNTPQNVKTQLGASITDLINNNISTEDNTRLIEGDVLSGVQVNGDEFLSLTSNQITAIKEGDNYELFGWLLPLSPRPSISGTFPNFLLKNYEFDANTNTHGEERAFVVTGQYEKMVPMDIYPQHLMKAIMTGEIEKMEALGINELSEEDVALAEFSCTSKMPLQSILREGLDMMRDQA